MKIGIAIATYNYKEQLENCLNSLLKSEGIELFVVVVDDNSSDGTWQMLEYNFPEITRLKGTGNLWWAGASNLAIKKCLTNQCDGIILLNPDVIVQKDTISNLVNSSVKLKDAIVTPIILDIENPLVIWEAGHRWEPVFTCFPIVWTFRYMFKHGTLISDIPTLPYKTVSVVGRGGYFPKKVFDTLGFFDEKNLPQYGSDAEMGLRAWRHDYPMFIIPSAKVFLNTNNTGRTTPKNLKNAIIYYFHYLVKRKNGEAIKVLFFLNFKNLPLYSALPTYIYMLLLNTFRYWQAYFSSIKKTNK